MKENKQAEEAFAVEQEIKGIKEISTKSIFRLGELFKRIRDEKLYRLLGEDCFTDYLAKPDLGYARSTVYNYIEIHEEFGGVDEARLLEIGHKRLAALLPVVNGKTPEEKEDWLDIAEHLSWKDCINDIRKAQGKPDMPAQGQVQAQTQPGIMNAEAYVQLVGNAKCLIPGCGHPADPHHFPRTKGAGAVDWHIIPLCRKHHTAAHDGGKDWLWENRQYVFEWFYAIIGGRT